MSDEAELYYSAAMMASFWEYTMRAITMLSALSTGFLLFQSLVHAQTDLDSPPVVECKPHLQQTFQQLHSDQIIDLCERAAGKALVVVNTASFCGFTPQFKALEALYEARKGEGLEIIGIPSDDFNQESADQAETATICFKNYGVSFMMTEPAHVTGPKANPLHRWLIETTGEAPRWNFHKYVIARDGRVVATFPSKTSPDAASFTSAVDQALSDL
ncbi:glutathione peroxidase [Allohahella marinimesophila]|uniref:Glutathione peroxidase n=1 Tax=Allohahella marinimesophila TaxID=1054972 RepID=A0ABP7PD10_9GAMM